MGQTARSLTAIVLITLLGAFLPPSLRAHEGDEKQGHKQGTGSFQPRPDEQNSGLKAGDPAPPFVLLDQDRKKIALSDLNGRPRFLIFIHTHCKDACPLILQNRRQVEQQVEPAIGKHIVFLAVTMDPEHDTPEALKAFIKKLGVETEDLHLLTGDVPIVKKVLHDYNIEAIRDPATGFIGPHTTVGYAINTKGAIERIYDFSL
jgi:cytochrome oxidase Cu insertion factor (SCO1/SenC/PrrC family)